MMNVRKGWDFEKISGLLAPHFDGAKGGWETISLKASLEKMYSDEVSLAWRLSKRRLRERQKFSVGDVTEGGASAAGGAASGGGLKASQLVKDMCADGAHGCDPASGWTS